MTSTIEGGDLMALALERLQLRFSKAIDATGRAFWHIPFNLPEPTMLTAYTGPIAAGVITTLGDVDPAHHEALLLLSGKLTLAKVVLLDHKGGIAVLAELPAGHVDEQSLRLAISGVLEGVREVRSRVGSIDVGALPASQP